MHTFASKRQTNGKPFMEERMNIMKQAKQNNNVEQQQKKQQPEKDTEKQPGYGDKKLEGPNFPAE
jgi:hypothetical protein